MQDFKNGLFMIIDKISYHRFLYFKFREIIEQDEVEEKREANHNNFL